MTVSAPNREATIKCRDTVYEIADNERKNITKTLAESVIPGTERLNMDDHHSVCEALRFVLFQMSLAEAYQHLSAACHAIDMTDEQLSAMCAERGETVMSAYKNAMSNIMMDVIMDMLKD